MYLAEDARLELGLHREDLVALAYFLGSDYAEGVTGVGIVNAVEIVHAFPMHGHSTGTGTGTGSGSSRQVTYACCRMSALMNTCVMFIFGSYTNDLYLSSRRRYREWARRQQGQWQQQWQGQQQVLCRV